MSPQLRQKFLILLFPGLVMGIAYVYALARPADQQIKATREAIEKAKEAAPKPAVEAQANARLRQSRQELDHLKKTKKADPATGAVSELDRAEAGRRLTAVLERHRLHLLEESAATSPGPLPPQLTVPGPGGSKAEGGARSLRFHGRYMDVLEALRELDGPEHRALPLRVKMERTAEEAKQLVWTLVLWL